MVLFQTRILSLMGYLILYREEDKYEGRLYLRGQTEDRNGIHRIVVE